MRIFSYFSWCYHISLWCSLSCWIFFKLSSCIINNL